MNTKHTPGPWLVADDGAFVYALSPSGVNAFWAHVQSSGKDRIRDEEKEANARLIAAAPDLFSAAHETVSALDDEYKLSGHDDDWIYDVLGSGLAAAYFSARTAIAKATGEQA